jgi:hypothetical protein
MVIAVSPTSSVATSLSIFPILTLVDVYNPITIISISDPSDLYACTHTFTPTFTFLAGVTAL